MPRPPDPPGPTRRENPDRLPAGQQSNLSDIYEMKFVKARKGIPFKSFKEHCNPWNAAHPTLRSDLQMLFLGKNSGIGQQRQYVG